MKSVLAPAHAPAGPDREALHLYLAVESLVDQITATRSITVFFDAEMFYEEGLPEKIKQTIFRMIREQFNKIVKQASASEVHVSLQRDPEKIAILIQDNGPGCGLEAEFAIDPSNRRGKPSKNFLPVF